MDQPERNPGELDIVTYPQNDSQHRGHSDDALPLTPPSDGNPDDPDDSVEAPGDPAASVDVPEPPGGSVDAPDELLDPADAPDPPCLQAEKSDLWLETGISSLVPADACCSQGVWLHLLSR